MMKRCLALVAAACLVCLVVSCSSTAESGPAQTVEQFYGFLSSGDYAGAMALYNEEALEILEDPTNLASDSGFAEWARQETKQGTVDRVEVSKEEVTDENATLEFDVFYNDGTSKHGRVTLTQEDGQWKLGLVG